MYRLRLDDLPDNARLYLEKIAGETKKLNEQNGHLHPSDTGTDASKIAKNASKLLVQLRQFEKDYPVWAVESGVSDKALNHLSTNGLDEKELNLAVNGFHSLDLQYTIFGLIIRMQAIAVASKKGSKSGPKTHIKKYLEAEVIRVLDKLDANKDERAAILDEVFKLAGFS